jgi:hypothetical protein
MLDSPLDEIAEQGRYMMTSIPIVLFIQGVDETLVPCHIHFLSVIEIWISFQTVESFQILHFIDFPEHPLISLHNSGERTEVEHVEYGRGGTTVDEGAVGGLPDHYRVVVETTFQ